MTALVLAAILAAATGGNFGQASAAFDAGDFDGALAQAGRALEHEPAGPKRAQLELLRARCLGALRRVNEVDEAIEAALNADPGLSVDPEVVSPGFQATVNRLKAELAGKVTVRFEGGPAAIRIDGALVGPAPVTQLLPVGRYQIAAINPDGREVASRVVVVAPRQQFAVTLEAASVAAPPKREEIGALPTARAQWSVMPAFSARLLIDFSAGESLEAGLSLLGRYWLAEVDAIGGGAFGLGARVGPRLPFASGLLSVQATLDGVVFFGSKVAPGVGGTLALGVRPFDFLEVLVEGSGRALSAQSGYRSGYLLLGLSARVRWPFADGP